MWNGRNPASGQDQGRGRAWGHIPRLEGNPLQPGRSPMAPRPGLAHVRPAVVDVDALARDLEAVLRAHCVPLVVVPPPEPSRNYLSTLPSIPGCLALEAGPPPPPKPQGPRFETTDEGESPPSTLMVSPRDYLLPVKQAASPADALAVECNAPEYAEAAEPLEEPSPEEPLPEGSSPEESLVDEPSPEHKPLRGVSKHAVTGLFLPPPPVPPKSVWARGPAPRGMCWQCRSNGHDFYDCPYEERFLYCCRCGWAHESVEWCPKCSTKYWRQQGEEPSSRPKFMTWAREYHPPNPRSYKDSHRSPRDLATRRAYYERQLERQSRCRQYRDPDL